MLKDFSTEASLQQNELKRDMPWSLSRSGRKHQPLLCTRHQGQDQPTGVLDLENKKAQKTADCPLGREEVINCTFHSHVAGERQRLCFALHFPGFSTLHNRVCHIHWCGPETATEGKDKRWCNIGDISTFGSEPRKHSLERTNSSVG